MARQVGVTKEGGRRGGHVVIASATDINMETFRPNNTPNLPWHRLVYNTLTQYDHETLEPQPQLATDWESSDQGRVLTVRLRDDVRFHSGRPLEAADVLETVRWHASTEGAPAQLQATAAVVEDLDQTGPYEIRLRLAHTATNLFDLFEKMYVIDRETVDKVESGTFNGTGPFQIADRNPGLSVAFERDPKYWKEGRPFLDSVELRVMPEPQSVVAALQSDQVQLAFNLTGQNLRNLASDERFRITEPVSLGAGFYVGCNVEVPPVDDKRVRQAISYAVDREKVRRMGISGFGITTCIPWTPGSPAYDETADKHYTLDLDRARDLLQQAGAEGARFDMAYPSDPGPSGPISEIVQDGLRALGLSVTLRPMQGPEFTTRLTTGTLPGLWIAGHGYGSIHPASLLTGAFPFNAEANASNFDSDEYRRLAEQVWKAPTPEAEQAVYAEVTEFFLDQQFVIELVSSSYTYLSTKALRGNSYTMFENLVLDDAYLA